MRGCTYLPALVQALAGLGDGKRLIQGLLWLWGVSKVSVIVNTTIVITELGCGETSFTVT